MERPVLGSTGFYLPLGNLLSVRIQQQVLWASETLWTLWPRERFMGL